MAAGIQEAGFRFGRAPQFNVSAAIQGEGVTADLGVLMQSTTTLVAEMETPTRINSTLLANGGYLDAATINDHKILNINIVNAATSNSFMNQQLVKLNELLLFSEGKLTGAPQNLRIEYYNALLPDEKVVGNGKFITATYPTLSVGGETPDNIIKPYTFRFLPTREDIGGFNLSGLINTILSGIAIIEGL